MAEPLRTFHDETSRKPPWLRARLGGGTGWQRVRRLLSDRNLHTVCEEALCPNCGTCWEQGRATIMILGDRCSRRCAFCNVGGGMPQPPDADEPARVAASVRALGLRDVVITSVTRDDLPDGGAAAWADTIRRVREVAPGVVIEVLVPDFGGCEDSLRIVLEAGPDVVGHNLETVPSLYPRVRPQAGYERSLELLRRVQAAGFIAKTGLMVGLGENLDEVLAVMRDARACGCDIFSVGQYLRPSPRHLPVRRFVTPEEFHCLENAARSLGFPVVVSGPLVRSSFHSSEQERFVSERRRGAMARGIGAG